MTNDELIDHIANCAGITKVQAKRALQCMQDGVIKGLKATGTLRLQIGSFILREETEHQGGPPLLMSERKVVGFKPSNMLKEVINEEGNQSKSTF